MSSGSFSTIYTLAPRDTYTEQCTVKILLIPFTDRKIWLESFWVGGVLVDFETRLYFSISLPCTCRFLMETQCTCFHLCSYSGCQDMTEKFWRVAHTHTLITSPKSACANLSEKSNNGGVLKFNWREEVWLGHVMLIWPMVYVVCGTCKRSAPVLRIDVDDGASQ